MNMRVNTSREIIRTQIYAMGVDRKTPISEVLEQIKKYENQDNIEIEISSFGNLRIYEVSEESDEQYNKRIERDTKQINELNERWENDRYKAYLDLKKIYEPNK